MRGADVMQPRARNFADDAEPVTFGSASLEEFSEQGLKNVADVHDLVLSVQRALYGPMIQAKDPGEIVPVDSAIARAKAIADQSHNTAMLLRAVLRRLERQEGETNGCASPNPYQDREARERTLGR